MESTSFNKTNDKFYGATQTANKWANEIGANMMDMYKKQMDLAFGFYNNLFCSLPEMNKNVWDSNMNFNKPYGNEIYKLFNPFNWYNMGGPSVDTFMSSEDIRKRVLEFSNNCVSCAHDSFKNAQANWSELNEKIQEVVEKNWETRRNGINSIAEVINKQVESLIESNKKIMEDMGGQFHSAAKQNEKPWTEKDGIKTTSPYDKAEKEHEQPAAKKTNKTEFAASSHNNKYHQ